MATKTKVAKSGGNGVNGSGESRRQRQRRVAEEQAGQPVVFETEYVRLDEKMKTWHYGLAHTNHLFAGTDLYLQKSMLGMNPPDRVRITVEFDGWTPAE